MFNWLKNLKRKRRTKKFIQWFIDHSSDSIVLKKWEHNFWGNAIYVNDNGFYGHLSGLRSSHLSVFRDIFCDLRDRDVIVMNIPSDMTHLSDGKRYEIGLFSNVRVQADPPDMFFANYIRLGFADNYDLSTIIKLAKERIASL